MKAVSLHQPYATLWAAGLKRIETRVWNTTHRGPLLVHAAQYWSGELDQVCRRPEVAAVLSHLGVRGNYVATLPRGALVGVVSIYATVRTQDAAPTELERALGDFRAWRYAWLAEGHMLFSRPIPWAGRQRIFEADVDRTTFANARLCRRRVDTRAEAGT